LFFGNDTIDHVSISAQYDEFPSLPSHRAASGFGNNATIDRVSPITQQLSYDGIPYHLAARAFLGNDATIG
jgi:hypothetical protein